MIAGDQDSRSLAPTKQQQAVTQWYCHDPDTVDSGFPAGFTQCGYGFAGSIHFPHCWNGEAFDIANPYAHMSYPVGDHPDSGYCPASHPNVLPHIFIEFWFDVAAFNGLYTASDHPWVLSNGDKTGYSFHADFINGWETGILKNAMTNCNIGESGAPLSDCFEVWTDAERNACKLASVVPEVIDGWLEQLPGCNPVSSGPERATAQQCDGSSSASAAATLSPSSVSSTLSSSTSVTQTAILAASSTATESVDVVDAASTLATSTDDSMATTSTSGPPAYTQTNEALDSTSTAVTTTQLTAPAQTTTVDDSYSYPSDSTPTSSTPTAPMASNSVPFAVPGTASNSTLPVGWTSVGCYTDSIHPRALTGITFANIGTKISSTGCVAYCDKRGYAIAGTEYGGQCFCGQSLQKSTKAAESICSMVCEGDKTQLCGGKAALNVFKKGSKSVGSARWVRPNRMA
jgi:hypothetical protein